MLVPNTIGAILINKMKGREPVMCELTDFKVKYAEAGGTPLINMFSQDTCRGAHFNRDLCHPCDSTAEDKRQNCRERSILYETSCKLCNPDEKGGPHSNLQPDQLQPKARLGVYLGETSRSLHERMAEHVDDARKFQAGSHIVKHWMEVHPETSEMPPWRFKIVNIFKDCLTRQLTEAKAISLSGDGLLNGKCDYLTNCITRVTLDEDVYEKKKREMREEFEEKERIESLENFKKEKSANQTGIKRKRMIALDEKSQSTKMTKTSVQTDQLNGVEVEENLPIGWKEEITGNGVMCVAGLQTLAKPGVGIASQSSTQLEVDEKDSKIGENESSINKTKEIKEKDVIKNNSIRRIKYKQKNTAAQSNYILNLYGLSAWWESLQTREEH